MISQEELEIVKAKIEEKKQTNERMLQKIKAAEKDNELLNKIQEEVKSYNQEVDIENERVIKQIAELKDQIVIYKKGDPEGRKRNHQLKKQLTSLENTLANNIEKFEQAQRNQDILELQVKQLTAQDEELTPKVKKLDKAVHLYHNYKKNFPRCAATLLNIVDLESHLHFYTTQIIRVRNSVKCQIEKINKMNKSISDKENEIIDLQKQLELINNNIQSNEQLKNQLYADLQGYNTEFEKLNQERKEIDEHFHKVIDLNHQLDLKNINQVSLLRENLLNLSKEIASYPDLINQFEDENKKQLETKKDLVLELQKKIDLAIIEIRKKNSNSPQMLQQIHNLEEEWREHDKLSSYCQNLEKKMYNVQDLLQRKKMILEETRRQVVKKTEKPGIQHLIQFFEEERLENKKLEMKIIKINRDLEIYQSEQAQFLRELNELP